MRKRAPLAAAAAVMATAAIAVLPGSGQAAATACPATFSVLHDDSIGALKLPQGSYAIGVTGLSCAEASGLFQAFLADWDGNLPQNWTATAVAVGQGSFADGTGRSFTVRFVGSSGGGGGGGLVCGRRVVLKSADRIGALQLAKGRYLIDRLSAFAPGCGRIRHLLAGFLKDFDGILPGGWVVLPQDATFVNGSTSYGFRLEPDTNPNNGGGPVPTHTTRCGGTFRVLHQDHVGRLQLPAGRYWISRLKGSNIRCGRASRLFRSFLNDPSGQLPSPWVVRASSGTFRRGRHSRNGFAVKPAFHVGG